MKLRNKFLLAAAGPMLLSLALLGYLSLRTTHAWIMESVTNYGSGVLETYISQDVAAREKLLRDNGLDTFASFVQAYQQEAAEAARNIKLIWPGHIAAFDLDGRLVFDTGNRSASVMESAWREVIQKICSEKIESTQGHNDHFKPHEIYVGKCFKPWKWFVLVTISEEVVTSQEDAIRTAALAVSLACLALLALLLAMVFQRYVARPLSRIKQATARIAGQESVSEIDVQSRDELGELARDIEKMSGDLDSFHREILVFRELAEKSGQGFGMATPGGKIVYANETLCRMVGKSKASLAGQPIERFYPSEARLRLEGEVMPAIMRHGRWKGELEISGPAGPIPTLEDFFIIHDQAGVPLYLADVITDISDLKRLESRLRRHQARLETEVAERTLELKASNNELRREIEERGQAEKDRAQMSSLLGEIIDAMPSALAGLDARGRITHWNRQATVLTGIPAKQAHGRSLHDLFPGGPEETKPVFDAVQARTELHDFRVEIERDGTTMYLDVTVYPLSGKSTGVVVVRVDDASVRVRMEERMVQSEKMHSVGGLAAGMAHEINNPLAAILGNAQVALNRTSTDKAGNIRAAEDCGTNMKAVDAYLERRGVHEMLRAIMDSGHRAAAIVDNMLSFSRKSEFETVLSNPVELLEQALNLASNDYDLSRKYDFRQIEIVREYDSELPTIPCDPIQLQQVFLNILKNGAWIMAETQSNAEAELPRFILRAAAEPFDDTGRAGVRIEIEDNGPGMEEADRKRVFEPFFTTKPAGSGTGLGLSVSYFIITRNHSGRFSVDSAPGRGARFIITLPAKE